MIEDPSLQDPLSLNFTEDYKGQSLISVDFKKTPASPSSRSETPEIHVIIKEEEEGWTVNEDNESFNSGEKEENSTRACHPLVKVDGKESFFLYEEKGNEWVYLEESDGPALGQQSSSSREEEQQRKRLMDPDERTFCSGTVTAADRCIKKAKASSCERKKKSLQQARVADELVAIGRTLDRQQSKSLHAEHWEAAGSAAGQTDPPKLKLPTSHGSKTSSANLEDQSLCLDASLEAENQEEDPDEEIGGLINSDGEVVDWDAKDNPDQESQRKDVFLPKCELRVTNRRDSSPTLIMEVVEDNDERAEEEEENNRVVTVTAASSLICGKRRRKKKKIPETTVTLDDTEPENEAAPPVKRRSKRNLVDSSALLCEKLLREEAKRPYRRRKATKTSAEHSDEKTSVPAGKKRPGRKMVCVPLEIPPELLKKPKERIQYHCSVCGKEFPHAYKLERHELIHTGEKPYCCSVCGRGFNQKGNLKTHYKVHFGGKDEVDFGSVNPAQSDFCKYLKSLPGESKIRSSLHCLECGKKCESQSALQAHHITTHAESAAEPTTAERSSSAQLLFCRRCNIQFSDQEKLQEHMKAHVKEKRYSCPDCGKRFINESYIQVHQRIHTGEKPFLCSQCGRGFHTASSLKLHEMQHSGERPFACSVCGKTFRINSYLTAHYQTHIRDRPFICNVCGKGYSRAEELKVHHRLHTGERPYECSECGKSFIYRQGLRQHQRTHEGRRIGPTRQLGRPKQEVQPHT